MLNRRVKKLIQIFVVFAHVVPQLLEPGLVGVSLLDLFRLVFGRSLQHSGRLVF